MKVAVIYNKKNIDPTDVINIYGMTTKEHYNPQTVEQVAAALERGGHTVKIIEGTMGSMEELHQFMAEPTAGEPPGIVFNMAYGIQGHDRYTHLPAMLEMLGVPYTGSGPEAHAIVQDKVMTKIVLQKNQLPTANYWVFSTPDDTFDDLQFPVIVKPKMESTSMGMRVADNYDDLRDAVREEIDKYQQDALVEQFISGREFAVGMVGNGHHLEIFPIVEFELGRPDDIQTKSDKLSAPRHKLCPAPLDDETAKEMKQLCRTAFQKLGLHDYTRVDIRMDRHGQMYILELNSMASLGKTGSFVAGATVAGYSYDSLINKMLDVAAIRNFGESPARPIKLASGQPLYTVVRSYLRTHLETTTELLRHMLEMNTHVRDVETVNRMGTMVSKRLEHLGFSEHVHHFLDIGNVRYFANHIHPDNDVLILSHLDTPYSYHDHTPFRETKTKIYGTGVTESKGGLAVMLSALQALRFSKRLRRIRCGILLTTDDSLDGKHSADLIREYASRSRYVLSMKWGDLDGGVVISGHGRDDYHVEIRGVKSDDRPTISGLIPYTCKKIVSLDRLSTEGCRVMVPTLKADTSYGSSPDKASITVVTSYDSFKVGDDVEKKIRHVLKRSSDHGDSEGVKIDVSRWRRRDPVLETDATQELYSMAEKVAMEAHIPIKPKGRFVSSDISHVPTTIPSLEGLGPLGAGFKSPDEYILMDSLIDRALLLAILVRECAKQRTENDPNK